MKGTEAGGFFGEKQFGGYRITARRRRQLRRRLLRLGICGLWYGTLLAVTVAALLGLVWILKNTGTGLPAVSALCLAVSGLLFFRLAGDERGRKEKGSGAYAS